MANQYPPIESIRIDGGTQTRCALHEDTVNEYAEAMLLGKIFPPIVLFHDGADYWLADGFHRYHASRKCGRLQIAAAVLPGTRQDAVKYALGANVTNGLRRTNADKRRGVEIALAEFPELSDESVAELCAVSGQTVANHRKSFQKLEPEPETRTGRDGKQHPTRRAAKPAQITPAPAAPPAVPDDSGSAEEIAPETAPLSAPDRAGEIRAQLIAVEGQIAGLRNCLDQIRCSITAGRAELAELETAAV